MRPPRFSRSLSILLLLPWLATALPQDAVPAPSSEPTTTSTSTSTLTVTRTLIRGTAVVIATLPAISISDAVLVTSTLPDIAAPTGSVNPNDVIIAAPNASNNNNNTTLTLAPSATGTGPGAGKPLLSTTGPAPATFTGGAASIGGGGGNVVMMGMAIVGGWALMGTWL